MTPYPINCDDPLPIRSLAELPTFHMLRLVPLLGEQVAGEALLPSLVPGELQVHDGPALVGGHPYGTDAGELGEAVREILEVVARDVEDGEGGEGGDVLRGELQQLVVAQGEDGEGRALADLRWVEGRWGSGGLQGVKGSGQGVGQDGGQGVRQDMGGQGVMQDGGQGVGQDGGQGVMQNGGQGVRQDMGGQGVRGSCKMGSRVR